MTKLERLQRELRDMGADHTTVEFVTYVPITLRNGSTLMAMQVDMPRSLAAARDRIDMLRNGVRIDRRISKRDTKDIRRRMHIGRVKADAGRKYKRWCELNGL